MSKARKIVARPRRQRITEPDELPVQLNIKVPYWFREHLTKQAASLDVSLNRLCVDALQKAHPAKIEP